jgi:hypothetical protein
LSDRFASTTLSCAGYLGAGYGVMAGAGIWSIFANSALGEKGQHSLSSSTPAWDLLSID